MDAALPGKPIDAAPRNHRYTAHLVCAMGGYAALGGLITLIGWFANIPRLASWEGNGISMMPNAAICAICAGTALVLLPFHQRRFVAALGLLVGLIGAATLFEYMSGIDLGIDRLLVSREWGQRGTVVPGRMGPPGATSWTIIGAGLVLMTGSSEAEFVGQDMALTIFTPEDVRNGAARQELEEAAASGRSADDRWMRKKDGERFFAFGVTTALRDGDGGLVGFMKVMRDQTKRKEMEDELRRIAAELSEADRRKNEFLAMLAHELRNPLAPIRNALQVVQLSTGDEQAVQTATQMMNRQINQMVHLVDDLLDVSRISRGKIDLRKERVDLASIIQQAIETSRPAIESALHEIVVTLPSQPVHLLADSVRLAQVFSNLLNNAAKYTDRGGRIWLTAERQSTDAVVSVKDTGVGISSEMLPKIFEMFTQVDRSIERSQGGLGIGLT